jgi:hydroxyquinol 1,2-dioxygenase
MLHSSPQGTSSIFLGPFHITGSPKIPVGGDLVGKNPGDLIMVRGVVTDTQGMPIGNAELDFWQTAANALYSSQDDKQGTYNFHGVMTTGPDGRYALTTIKPVAYTVPTDGPVGEILRATGRHPWRPSHLHVIVKAPGFKPLVTELFPDDDPYLDQDTVFGVRDGLVMSYRQCDAADYPAGLERSLTDGESFEMVEFDLKLIPESVDPS